MMKFWVPIISVLCLSIMATGAAAGSRVSAFANGKTIEVTSDRSNSRIHVSNGNTTIWSDGLLIRLDGATLTLGDHTQELGSFAIIEMTIVRGKVLISVDGGPWSELN